MKKILYIEDEADEVLMVRTRLENAGYTLISAADGAEGLDTIRANRPDLILLDIMMPELNGYEVCDQLKKDVETANIPIIIVTASGAKDLENRCEVLGVEEIIQKPYESSYLLERIAFYLGE